MKKSPKICDLSEKEKVESAYEPKWPNGPELIPVSVALRN